jgi:hypothetical protein
MTRTLTQAETSAVWRGVHSAAANAGRNTSSPSRSTAVPVTAPRASVTTVVATVTNTTARVGGVRIVVPSSRSARPSTGTGAARNGPNMRASSSGGVIGRCECHVPRHTGGLGHPICWKYRTAGGWPHPWRSASARVIIWRSTARRSTPASIWPCRPGRAPARPPHSPNSPAPPGAAAATSPTTGVEALDRDQSRYWIRYHRPGAVHGVQRRRQHPAGHHRRRPAVW